MWSKRGVVQADNLLDRCVDKDVFASPVQRLHGVPREIRRTTDGQESIHNQELLVQSFYMSSLDVGVEDAGAVEQLLNEGGRSLAVEHANRNPTTDDLQPCQPHRVQAECRNVNEVSGRPKDIEDLTA